MGTLGRKKGERDIQRVQALVLRKEATAGGDALSHPAEDKVPQKHLMALILCSYTLLWWFMWTSSLLAWQHKTVKTALPKHT